MKKPISRWRVVCGYLGIVLALATSLALFLTPTYQSTCRVDLILNPSSNRNLIWVGLIAGLLSFVLALVARRITPIRPRLYDTPSYS